MCNYSNHTKTLCCAFKSCETTFLCHNMRIQTVNEEYRIRNTDTPIHTLFAHEAIWLPDVITHSRGVLELGRKQSLWRGGGGGFQAVWLRYDRNVFLNSAEEGLRAECAWSFFNGLKWTWSGSEILLPPGLVLPFDFEAIILRIFLFAKGSQSEESWVKRGREIKWFVLECWWRAINRYSID